MAMLTRKNVGMALTREHKQLQRVTLRASAWKVKVPGPSSDPYKTGGRQLQGCEPADHSIFSPKEVRERLNQSCHTTCC